MPEDVFIFSQTDLKGRITEANGYQSIRFQPTREQGEAASEAYRRIRKGDRSLKIEDGRVVSQRAAWLETAAGSRMQLRLIMTFALAAAIPGVGALMAAPPSRPSDGGRGGFRAERSGGADGASVTRIAGCQRDLGALNPMVSRVQKAALQYRV